MATEGPARRDDELVAAVHAGDGAALEELLERHLHPAWRIAVVAAPDTKAAEQAVVDGVCDALVAEHRHPDPTIALRERIVGATRRAAATAPATPGHPPVAADEPVVAAFRALPEAWRSAVWLSEVEGGAPEQISKVLGLDRSAAAALTDRATAGLRDRLAADVADRAEPAACRKALAKLPALAVGKLTARERGTVEAHMRGCGSCALWLAALVAPRPALRRIVPAVPARLPLAIVERWTRELAKERKAWLAPWTERAVGAAAAAVLAVGLAGAALLGGRDSNDGGTRLASPAGTTDAGGTGSDGESAAGAPPVPTTSTTPTIPSTSGGGGAGGTSGSDSTRPTGTPRPAPAPSTPITPSTPSTPSTPTTPITPTPPSTDEPDPEPPPDTPPPTEDVTQVALGVLEVIEVGVGDCTGVNLGGTVLGCDPVTTGPASIDIVLPGLPPLSL